MDGTSQRLGRSLALPSAAAALALWRRCGSSATRVMDQLRIGLVGAGLIGSTHSLMLQQIAERWPDRVRLVAVADPDAGNCRQFIELYGYGQAFARGDDLIARANINALYV